MTESTDWRNIWLLFSLSLSLVFQYFVFMKWEQSVSQAVGTGEEEWSSNNGLMMIRVRVLLLLKLRCEKEIFEWQSQAISPPRRRSVLELCPLLLARQAWQVVRVVNEKWQSLLWNYLGVTLLRSFGTLGNLMIWLQLTYRPVLVSSTVLSVACWDSF